MLAQDIRFLLDLYQSLPLQFFHFLILKTYLLISMPRCGEVNFPEMVLSKVVFPAPFAPTNETISPLPT